MFLSCVTASLASTDSLFRVLYIFRPLIKLVAACSLEYVQFYRCPNKRDILSWGVSAHISLIRRARGFFETKNPSPMSKNVFLIVMIAGDKTGGFSLPQGCFLN